MLIDLLERYKEISLKVLQSQDVEEIDLLINYREHIINKLKENTFSKDDYLKAMTDLDIIVIEKKVGEKISLEKQKIKEELANIQRQKQANNKYASNVNTRNLFSVKI